MLLGQHFSWALPSLSPAPRHPHEQSTWARGRWMMLQGLWEKAADHPTPELPPRDQPQPDMCPEAPTPLPKISAPLSLQLELLRGLKCHGSLKALSRRFEICSAWSFAPLSLVLPELLIVPRLLLFSTLQNSNYWKVQGGLRARIQRCLRGCASPGRPGSGAVRMGGAVPLGFYLDENILTNDQETNPLPLGRERGH